jgi:hypothetical protein
MESSARTPQYDIIIDLITYLKNKGKNTINTTDIIGYIKYINKKCKLQMYNPDNIHTFVNDLNTLYDVKKKRISMTEYTIGIEWSSDIIKKS